MFSARHSHTRTSVLAAITLSLSVYATHAQITAADAASSSVTPLTFAQISAKLDPQMANVINTFLSIAGKPIVELTPQDARQQFSAEDAAKIVARVNGKALAPMPVGKVTDGVTIDGPDGNKIPIRIYTPAGTGPFPVILYFHGGGFVIATIDTYDASARALCDDAGAIVVSVEYRKSPEAPYPAALRDAIQSYKWVIGNIGAYDGISGKIALAGESAGGNLAAEVAIAARDQDLQRPTHQLLIYPVTSSNVNQTSDILYENAVPLSTPALKYFFKYYVANPSEANDPGVAPIQANLRGLAPATIVAAEIDPLQSDGAAYYHKLILEGNPAAYRLYPGTTHEFFGMGAVVDKAKAAEMYGAARIAASFK